MARRRSRRDMATLHTHTVQPWFSLTRLHILFHSLALFSLFYYRTTHLLHQPTLPWFLMTLAEAILAELWLYNQAFRWRPVTRSVATEKLPGEEKLPAVDIFVCTLDPEKEPTVQVMDTVISAMAMDYPSGKLAVYLSDDGGCPVTLYGMREAVEFAKEWVPFCRKYGVKLRCPKVFFSPMGEDEELLRTEGFMAEKEQLKVCMHASSFYMVLWLMMNIRIWFQNCFQLFSLFNSFWIYFYMVCLD